MCRFVYAVFCVVILLGVPSNHQVCSDEIYMCGTVVIDSTRDIKPLLDGTKNETSLDVGRCRWRLEMSQRLPSPLFVMQVMRLSVKRFCAQLVTEASVGIHPNCEVVYRGDVVKLVDVQVHLSDEDKTHGRDEDWYISRVTTYTTELDITLVNIDRLEDVFGSEWRTLGMGRGLEQLRYLGLILHESIPNMEGVFGSSWSGLRSIQISVPYGSLRYRSRAKLSALQIESPQIRSVLIDTPEVPVADLVLKSERLAFVDISCLNLGRLLLDKSRTHSVIPMFSLDNLIHLSLRFSSYSDRFLTNLLPKIFFNIEPKASSFAFVMGYHLKIPDREKKLMPTWSAGIPAQLSTFKVDWSIVDDKLAETVFQGMRRSLKGMPRNNLHLTLHSVFWNVSEWYLPESFGLYTIEISVLPLRYLPLEDQKSLVTLTNATTRTSPVPEVRQTIPIDVLGSPKNCALDLKCPECTSNDTLPVFHLPETCANAVSSYFGMQNLIFSRRADAQFNSLELRQLKTVAFSNVKFNYTPSLVVWNMSRLQSLDLALYADAFQWEQLFPCVELSSFGGNASECCETFSHFKMAELFIDDMTSFPFHTLNASMFCHMPRLRKLHLRKLPVEAIEGNTFDYNPFLSDIRITHSNISVVPDYLFANRRSSLIELSNNKISKVESKFCYQHSVKVLNLSDNLLREFNISALYTFIGG